MKYIGIIMLILSTSMTGVIITLGIKRKIVICRELEALCDILSLNITYKKGSISELLDNCLPDSLSFINSDCLISEMELKSPLGRDENEALSKLLFSLGKSDIKSQLMSINSFREYIKICENKYTEYYGKNSKIIISLSVFSGLTAAIILL